MKDWLLAEAIPATTLPMGANSIAAEFGVENIDMSTICKTDWPRGKRPETMSGRGTDWWHNDCKVMPYQCVYKFYDELMNRIK